MNDDRRTSATATAPAPERLLRRQEVEAITGLRRSTIYKRMREDPPTFPRCVHIGGRAVAWPEGRVRAWVAQQIASDDDAGS